MVVPKRDWILLALRKRPLDRIRIMKTLFLLWHRSGRNIEGYFHFEPYLYGPCSFDVYTELNQLMKEGAIVQPVYPIQHWAPYYLTPKGIKLAEEAKRRVEIEKRKQIEKIADEVSQLGFYELLRRVYSESPDFAKNSLLKGVIQR